MKNKKIILLVYCILLLCFVACATQNKSAGLGGLIGAGTGATLGGIVDPGAKGQYRTRNVIMGASLGAVAGAVTGSIIGGEMEAERKEAFLKGKASGPALSGNMPQLTTPKVESRWIEGRAVGNRFIEGHFEHLILETVRWNN